MLGGTYLQHIKYNMSIIDDLLSVLVRYGCPDCGVEGDLLCAACASKLPVASNYSDKYPALAAVRAVTNYSGVAEALVWQLKSSGAQAVATIIAAQMLKQFKPSQDMLIVPVPTASGRVRHRGYDQARLLARALARQAGLPYLDSLIRVGQTHQVGASREQRLQQLQATFRVRRQQAIKAASLLLVDDITTTGATLELAANALKVACAAQTEAIIFAQA